MKPKRTFKIVLFSKLSGFDKQRALKIEPDARKETAFRRYKDGELTIHPSSTGKIDRFNVSDPFFDRKSKLLPCQKEMMIFWYAVKAMTITDIAKMFRCSRRTVNFVIDPESYEQMLQKRKEAGGSSKYYDKKKHTAAIKRTRDYKKELIETFKNHS